MPPTIRQQEEQKNQMELQKASFVANTRLRLTETFLNTLLGRSDVDLTLDETETTLVKLAFDYSNALMLSLGMIVKTPVE